MTNTLLVKLATGADAVRLNDVIRLLRGVEAIEAVPSDSVRRLRETFAGSRGQGIDEAFLRMACATAAIVEALAADPPALAALAEKAGVEETLIAEMSGGCFARRAADALRITLSVQSIAPELLRRGREED